MKIIDLLNKIANGEEVPKKIIFDGTYWNRKIGEKNVYYVDENNVLELFIYLFRHNLTLTLNDEVEIIEDKIEEKKIPEKLDHFIGYDIDQFDNLKEFTDIITNDLVFKTNQVIDTLNQVIDCLKSKGDE